MNIDRWRSRLPVRRASDGESIGWTVSDVYASTGAEGDLVDALNPIGHVLAEDVSLDTAIDVVEQRGLASLDRPYWVRAPLPIWAGVDLERPENGWRWRRMLLTQLDDTRLWMRPAYPAWEERLLELPLTLPADEVLHALQPADSE